MIRPKNKQGVAARTLPRDAKSLVEPIIGFLYKSGFSKKQILVECRAALQKASSAVSRLPVIHVEFEKEAIDIVNRWLRDPKYLNHHGRPDELPLWGPRSVSSLVKDCKVAVPPNKALVHLLQFQIITKVASKQYRLIRRSMDFWHAEYLPFEPNFRFLVDATRAATNRLQRTKHSNNLFWQCADNRRIHSRKTSEFLSFVKQRGLSFMHEINDWLDEHEAQEVTTPRRRGRKKRLGVGLFGIASDHE